MAEQKHFRVRKVKACLHLFFEKLDFEDFFLALHRLAKKHYHFFTFLKKNNKL